MQVFSYDFGLESLLAMVVGNHWDAPKFYAIGPERLEDCVVCQQYVYK